jgi:hypothetical protein
MWKTGLILIAMLLISNLAGISKQARRPSILIFFSMGNSLKYKRKKTREARVCLGVVNLFTEDTFPSTEEVLMERGMASLFCPSIWLELG